MMQALFQKTSEPAETMKSTIELLGSNTAADKLIENSEGALVLAQKVLKYLKNINVLVSLRKLIKAQEFLFEW